MIITIDGPAGTGKSTIAKAVAERLKISYCDTGAMYRVAAWAILEKQVDLSDELALNTLLDNLSFTVKNIQGNKRYFVGTVDVTDEIRTQRINAIVSQVAALPLVRQAMWKHQRALAKQESTVFEGRDMGSVVFPDADLKIFLSASAEARAIRRLKELQVKFPSEVAGKGQIEVMQELKKRDESDSGRELAPLKKPEGAIEIDTTDLNIEEVIAKILTHYTSAQKKSVRKIYPGWLKKRHIPLLYRTVLFITWILFRGFYRLKVHGLEHFYNSNKAAIIAPNHTSYLDPPVIGVSWPDEVHYLAKEGLFKNALFGGFIRSLNSHPVRGDGTDAAVFKTILTLLSEGKKVVLFPEGKRSSGDLEPIKPGIGLLLMRSKSAIVPTYIDGTQAIWGKGRKLPKLYGKIHCVFGTPILAENFLHLERKEANEAIAKELEQAILALKNWLKSGAHGVPP